MNRSRRWLVWLLLWGLVFVFLYAALRDVPLQQVTTTLRQLKPGQVGVLAALNLLYLAVVNLRWWLILRSLNHPLPLLSVVAYRMAGFGLTYITPGPQFGGEPLQVHLVHTRHGVPLPEAVTSVFLDRLFDLLVNFTFLVFGVVVILTVGLPGALWNGSLLLPLLLFLLPAGHIAALWCGRMPITAAFNLLARRFGTSGLRRAADVARSSETHIARMLRQNSRLMAALLVISIAGWVLAVLEYALMLRYLGVPAGFAGTISAMTAARIAFLLPLPAGLGALEASQVLAASMLGWGASTGVAVSLVIRARDTLLALLGLVIGSWAASPYRRHKPRSEESSP